MRVDGAAQHERDLRELFALPRIRESFFAGDEMRFALHDGVDNLEMICLERAAGFRDLDDGIGQHGRLDFGCAPTELDLDVDALGGEVTLADFH